VRELFDEIQVRFFGDKLAEWLNERDSSNWQFAGRAGEAPALIYRNSGRELKLEMVGAYYDAEYARMLWSGARGVPGAKAIELTMEPDEKLVAAVDCQIAKKCGMAYGGGCALLVTVRPYLTTARAMELLLRRISIPERSPFDAIYLAGEFPMSSDSPYGYRVWQSVQRRIRAPPRSILLM
jgi:hypothetical protein